MTSRGILLGPPIKSGEKQFEPLTPHFSNTSFKVFHNVFSNYFTTHLLCFERKHGIAFTRSLITSAAFPLARTFHFFHSLFIFIISTKVDPGLSLLSVQLACWTQESCWEQFPRPPPPCSFSWEGCQQDLWFSHP